MARFLFLATALILLQVALAQTRCPSASYRVTIKGQFTSEYVPNAPPDPHFSPLTVASHSPRFSALVLLGYATKGIKNIAEKGDNTRLIEELTSDSASPFVMDLAAADGRIDGDGETSVVVRVNCNNSVITAVSMVAPSPDWFVAAANVNMFNGRFFIEKKEGDLFVYDAGTDSGTTFLAEDMRTVPRENIAPLGLPFTMPAATYKIERVRRPCPRAKYRLTVYNEWSRDRFPDAPDGNVLSPLTAFSHAKRYSAFTLFGFASPGVQNIAELGDNTLFLEELAGDNARPFVNDVNTTEGPAATGTGFSVELDVDCTSSFISFITMLFPSPDWIVARTSVNTWVENRFKRRIAGELFAYDAGTDSGETATAEDMPTDPPENIAMIQGEPFNGENVARFVLRKMTNF